MITEVYEDRNTWNLLCDIYNIFTNIFLKKVFLKMLRKNRKEDRGFLSDWVKGPRNKDLFHWTATTQFSFDAYHYTQLQAQYNPFGLVCMAANFALYITWCTTTYHIYWANTRALPLSNSIHAQKDLFTSLLEFG